MIGPDTSTTSPKSAAISSGFSQQHQEYLNLLWNTSSIMSTFFDTIKRSYEDVEITDKGINTSQFLEASESLVSLFGNPLYTQLTTDLLGSTAFAVVKNDMTGNIKVCSFPCAN